MGDGSVPRWRNCHSFTVAFGLYLLFCEAYSRHIGNVVHEGGFHTRLARASLSSPCKVCVTSHGVPHTPPFWRHSPSAFGGGSIELRYHLLLPTRQVLL